MTTLVIIILGLILVGFLIKGLVDLGKALYKYFRGE